MQQVIKGALNNKDKIYINPHQQNINDAITQTKMNEIINSTANKINQLESKIIENSRAENIFPSFSNLSSIKKKPKTEIKHEPTIKKEEMKLDDDNDDDMQDYLFKQHHKNMSKNIQPFSWPKIKKQEMKLDDDDDNDDIQNDIFKQNERYMRIHNPFYNGESNYSDTESKGNKYEEEYEEKKNNSISSMTAHINRWQKNLDEYNQHERHKKNHRMPKTEELTEEEKINKKLREKIEGAKRDELNESIMDDEIFPLLKGRGLKMNSENINYLGPDSLLNLKKLILNQKIDEVIKKLNDVHFSASTTELRELYKEVMGRRPNKNLNVSSLKKSLIKHIIDKTYKKYSNEDNRRRSRAPSRK